MEYEKKGFTLIELIAVIVILSIIILIASPITISIINKVQKSAFKDSAYGIIKAGEMYYTSKMMEPDGMTQIKTFNFSEGTEELKIKGSKPASGIMNVTKEGKIGLAVHNGKYCAKKSYVNDDVIVDENSENCEIPSILSSTKICIKDLNAICPNGTEVEVQVNNTESYNFYVIKDTKEELTLIMNSNIGEPIRWYSSPSTNTKGPLTALNYLKEQTSSWTNIPTETYRLNDDNNPPGYEPILIENATARMLTKTEAELLGCTDIIESCPEYLYKNTSSYVDSTLPYGYWFSTTNSANTYTAWYIFANGTISSNSVHYKASRYGVRPVITLQKTM